jgi:hypothetical protein
MASKSPGATDVEKPKKGEYSSYIINNCYKF